ncbi:DNA repair and recombination protein Rdh54p [Diutina catenulata]
MTVNAPFKPPRPLGAPAATSNSAGTTSSRKAPSLRAPGAKTAAPKTRRPPGEADDKENEVAKVAKRAPGPVRRRVGLVRTAPRPSPVVVPAPAPVTAPTPPSSEEGQRFAVQWRKKSNKKNKTWEGDGSVIATKSGESVVVVLKGSDGHVMSRKQFQQAKDDLLRGVVAVGGYEFEIDDDDVVLVDTAPAVAPKAPEVVEPEPELFVPSQPETVSEPSPAPAEPAAMPSLPDQNKPIAMPSLPDQNKSIAIDPILANKLRPHQVEGVRFMYEAVMGFRDAGRGCLLADEMGLGKTLQVITLVWTLLKQTREVSKIVVVCPVTLVSNWVAEFKKWLGPRVSVLAVTDGSQHSQIVSFGRLNVYQVLVVNYEKIPGYFEQLQGCPIDMVVCDEGHRLKSPTNKVLQHLAKLPCPRRIMLSGTPIQNDLQEFFTLVNYINPGSLGTWREFQQGFLQPILRGRDTACMDPAIKQAGDDASAALIAATSPFILRRTQSVLTRYLTPKTDTLLFVKPNPLQMELFQRILAAAASRMSSTSFALSLINLLRKVCNSPLLASDDELYRQLLGDSGPKLKTSSGKIATLVPMLQEITDMGEKVVLVSNYTHTLDLLETVVRKLNLTFVRLDGSTPQKMRGRLVREFNRNPQVSVFLLSSKAGGMGINLVGASRLILYDNDWNPSSDLQSMSRIHRDGQTKPCYIYRMFTTGCIDEKILQRQLMKTSLSLAFLDHSDDAADNVFDDLDLKRLFAIESQTTCNTHDLIECGCDAGTDDAPLFALRSARRSASTASTGSDIVTASDVLQSFEERDQASTERVKQALSEYTHINPATKKVDPVGDPALINMLSNPAYHSPVSFILTKTIEAGEEADEAQGVQELEPTTGSDPRNQ